MGVSGFLNALQLFIDSAALPETDEFREWLSLWAKRRGEGVWEQTWFDTKKEIEAQLHEVEKIRNGSSLREVASRLGCFNPATKGSGTSTAAAAIAVFLRYGGDVRRCVLEVVNLVGADTDTIGVMAGALCGAFGGVLKVPDEWIAQVQDSNYLYVIAEALVELSRQNVQVNPLRLYGPQEDPVYKSRDIMTLSRNRSVARNQRVAHPLIRMGGRSERGRNPR